MLESAACAACTVTAEAIGGIFSGRVDLKFLKLTCLVARVGFAVAGMIQGSILVLAAAHNGVTNYSTS